MSVPVVRRALVFLALLLAPAATASAGTLFLRDGRIFDGVELARGADGVTLRFTN